MKKVLFLIILAFVASCNKWWNVEQKTNSGTTNNSWTVDESVVSMTHDPEAGQFCCCGQCMGLNVDQKDEFLL